MWRGERDFHSSHSAHHTKHSQLPFIFMSSSYHLAKIGITTTFFHKIVSSQKLETLYLPHFLTFIWWNKTQKFSPTCIRMQFEKSALKLKTKVTKRSMWIKPSLGITFLHGNAISFFFFLRFGSWGQLLEKAKNAL